MTFSLVCPECHSKLKIKDELRGKTLRCPACTKPITIPTVESQNDSHSNAAQAATDPASVPVTVSTAASEPIETLGRFRLRAILGRGGFGTVYRAFDPILDREVALKVPNLGPQAVAAAERLVMEAKAAAKLRHPNLVAVYEAGNVGGKLYVATEFVAGQNLAELSREDLADLRTTVTWVRDVALGLQYAHETGVIHRDVKPQNVLVDQAGRAQLADFGLARLVNSDGPSSDGTASVGTPAYAAPEQLTGDTNASGPACDQYGLGVLLSEMLIGRCPFSGSTSELLEQKRNQQPPSLRAMRANLPRDLEAVCQKAIAADPANRYPNCAAFAQDMDRWLEGELVLARSHSLWEQAVHFVRRHPAATGWMAAAACLLALIFGGGTALALNHSATRSNPIPAPKTDPITTDTKEAIAPAADQSSQQTAEMLLYGRLLDRTRLAYHQRDVIAADHWLEQTRWDFRNWEYNYLRRIVTGGWKTYRNQGAPISAVAFHPDGYRFAAAAGSQVQVWDVASGDVVRTFSSPARPAQFQPITALAYSPDGKSLIVAKGTAIEGPTPMMMEMPVVAAAPAPDAEVAPTPAEAVPAVPAEPVAAPAPAAPSFAATVHDALSGEVVGEYVHPGPIGDLVFSPDGQLVASAGVIPAETPNDGPPDNPPPRPTGVIRLWKFAARETVREIPCPFGPVHRLAFSADGAQLAAAVGDGMWGQVLVWNITEGSPTPSHEQQPESVRAPNDSSVMQFFGGHSALAFHPQMPQLLGGPARGVMMLERGRLRANGIAGLFHLWTMGSNGPPTEVHGLPDSIRAMTFSATPGPFGNYPLAVAGGDLLQTYLPGIVTLHDPSYEFGSRVPHLGHTSTITAFAFRPDGKQFVTGSADGELKVWSAEVHPEVVKVSPHRTATRVAFGKDGRFVAVAEASQSWTEVRDAGTMPTHEDPGEPSEVPRGAVRLFDIRNGQEVLELTSGPGDVLGLAVDPDLKWVAAGGQDGQVHVWDLPNGQLKWEATAHGVVRYVAVSHDGSRIAAACGAAEPVGSNTVPQGGPAAPAPAPPPLGASNSRGGLTVLPVNFGQKKDPVDKATGDIIVWNVADGKEVARWTAHGIATLSVAFSPDDQQIVSSGRDRTVKLWNLSDQKMVQSLEAYDGEVVDLTFRPTGRDIAGVGFDPCRAQQPGDVLIWTADEGRRRLTLGQHEGLVYGVTYSADGKRFATGGGAFKGSLSQPGVIKVYDSDTGIELLPLAGSTGRGHKNEGQYQVTKQIQIVIKVPETEQYTVDVEVDGKIVKEIKTRTKYVEQFQTKQVTEVVGGGEVAWEEPGTVLGVAFSADGRSLAAACENGTALIWDAIACTPSATTPWPSGYPQSVAASPDGKWIAAGGNAGEACDCLGLIRIYDVTTGRVARTIETAGPVNHLTFAADSRRLAGACDCNDWFPEHCGSSGQQSASLRPDIRDIFFQKRPTVASQRGIEVWDVITGERQSSISNLDSPVVDLVFAAGDQLLGSSGDSVIVWNAATGKQTRAWRQLAKSAAALAVSPDGKQFAVIGASGSWEDGAKVLLGDVESDATPQILKLPASHRNVGSLSFSADGEKLIAGAQVTEESGKSGMSPTGGLLLWTLKSLGDPQLVSVKEPIQSVTSLPDNKQVVIKNGSPLVHVIDVATGESKVHVTGHRDQPLDLAATPDHRLVTVGYDQRLKVWQLDKALTMSEECQTCSPPRLPPVMLKPQSYGFVKQVKVSRDGRFAATGGSEIVQALRPAPRTTQPVPTPDQPQAAPEQPKFNAVVHLYQASTGQKLDTVTVLDAQLSGFDLSPDGRWVVIANERGIAIVWDREAKQAVAEAKGHEGPIHWIAFDPAGKQFATAGQDATVRIWNLKGQQVDSFKHESPVKCVAFDAAGKVLAAGDQQGKVRLWDRKKKSLMRELDGHYGELTAVSFNGDGTRLAATSRRAADQGWEGDLKIWDVATGKRIVDIPAHTWWDADVAFHPTEKYVVMTGKQHTVQYYDAETGQLISSIPTYGYLCSTMAFTPDGTRLFANLQGTPKLIDARPALQPFAKTKPTK